MSSFSNEEELNKSDEDDFITFQPYSSFRNAYVESEVEYIKNFVPDSEEWVALEKIHGCNFSATTDGQETKWASRSGYLDEASLIKFNNAPLVIEKYGLSIQSELFELVKAHMLDERMQEIAYIRVFGELCGGKYEGHKVRHKAIQKEVSYTPDIEFVVFDIECVLVSIPPTEKQDEEEPSEDEILAESSSSSYFLNPLEVVRMCQTCGVPAVEILHSGRLEDMLGLSKVFQSTIGSNIFNLQPTSANNEAEGYVLKPKFQTFYKPDQTRIMLKHKNPKFTENRNTKAVKVPKSAINGSQDLSAYEAGIFEEMKQFINENRINAVLSKLDEAIKSHRKGVIFLIANDAHDDIVIEMPALASASNKEKGKYKKHLVAYTQEYCDFHNIEFST